MNAPPHQYVARQASATQARPSRGAVWLLFAALFTWAASFFGGALFTGLVPMTDSSWRLWIGLRLAWVVAGALFVGVVVAKYSSRKALLPVAGICLAIGLAVNFNAVIDFVRGSIVVDGKVTKLSGHTTTRTGRSHPLYHVEIERPDGSTYAMDPSHAQRIDERWSACWGVGAKVHLVVLGRLEVVTEATCRGE